MKTITPRMYRVSEFAELAGVSVRALHHYDHLGLLKPNRRAGSGYRLYTEADLARLEQIVVLKFIGLPLKEIRKLLKGGSALREALGRQQFVLEEKRRQLDTAIHAIRKAELSIASHGAPDFMLFKTIIQEIEMQNDVEWSKKYYSPEAQKSIDERKALWSPELQEKVSRQWAQLISDVEAALSAGEDPAGSKGRALAGRWKDLVAGFSGGNPEVQKGLNKMWADQANWPEAQRSAYAIKPEIQQFIVTAMKR